ncbi:MAG: cation-translocating P-type ATPase [Bacteroidetes bacterium]|nr:cation-translocating P-type ATPase [Bacteroidota bacterium]
MSDVKKYKTDLIRIASMAAALLLSWLGVWNVITSFDFIALAATLIGGYPMYEEAFEAIRKRKMTMELSMSIAVIATLLIGSFFTGLVITFFVLIAELLEDLTVDRGRKVIEKLIQLLPDKISVRRNDVEIEIELNNVKLNDIVIVKPGSRIPVDGEVIKGNSYVDQSSISGESLPIEKMEGFSVYAGTINQTGILEVKPTKIGKDTTFGKIIEIIEKAEKSKAPIQKTADKLAARLVYFAFAGAAITFLFTRDIQSTISALIVAGACGVAAGTPLAILAGIGRTAKEGIIVKGGIYLEQLGKVDTIVLDKTGTLTLGIPKVVHISGFNGYKEKDILTAAATAEQHSEHPLADAILNKAREIGVTANEYQDIKYFPGKGIICSENGSKILVDNSLFLKENLVEINSDVTNYLEEKNESGETDVLVASNRVVLGAVSVADVLREEAMQAVEELKNFGNKVILLTGDSLSIANKIGEKLKVDEVYGEMLPQQKLEKIQRLNNSGKIVAMVGDGVNDAPALIEANVGIAMGTATAVALESADIALANNNLNKIVEAIKISRQCLNVISFNFWGTVAVDTAGIALAFMGFLTPLLAALIHVISELVFILNSARLFSKR